MSSFSNEEIEIIWLTIRVAFTSTLCTLPIAVWVGWVLARKRVPGKSIIESLITLPLVAPPVVTGYLLLLLLGRNGLLGKWLFDNFGIQLSFNFAALVIASIIVSFPLAVRTIRSSFEQVDPVYEKAAMTIGASKFQSFIRVTLPLAFPGILSGMVLAFARSLGEFGATITLAGNIPGKTQTLSLMVWSLLQIPGREGSVARLVIVSLAISLLAIIVSETMNKRRKYLKP